MANPILYKWKIGTIKVNKTDKRRNLYLIKTNHSTQYPFLFHFIKTMPQETRYEGYIYFRNDLRLLDRIERLKMFVSIGYLEKNEIIRMAKTIIEKYDCKIDFKMLNDILLAEDI